MKKYIEHLKAKGYKVSGEQAVLCGTTFNICSGILQRATGNYKSYWLELR